MLNEFIPILPDHVSHALGWTIIHSLWQVSLLALIMSALHNIYKDRSAELKYNISICAMTLALMTSVITFLIYYSVGQSIETTQTLVVFSDATLSKSIDSEFLSGISMFFDRNVEHINLIWTAGVGFFILRFLSAYAYVKFLKYDAIAVKDTLIYQQVKEISQLMGMKKLVQVTESARISVPMVVGYIKPMILFPVGMVNMLSSSEIEAIIVHELSHVRRNDYLMNIIVTFVEILYYFHPAIWWISANIKSERENCCDDAAIRYNSTPIDYARALVKIEEIRKSGIPTLAMPLASNNHHLLNRIKRILNMQQTKNDIREKSMATILLFSIVLLFTTNVQSENSLISEMNPRLIEDTSSKVEAESLLVSSENEVSDHSENNHSDIESAEDELSKNLDKSVSKTQLDNSTSIIIEESIQRSLEGVSKQITLDTLPRSFENNSTIIIKKNDNGQQIELEKSNGKITSLKIDGRQIPSSEYGKYQSQIDGINNNFKYSFENDFDFEGDFGDMDSMFSKSFGMLFDGENWREFGGNLEQLLDSDIFEDLKEMEGLRSLEKMEGLESLKELENLNLDELQPLLEEMGIQLDSSMKLLKFDIEDSFDGFDGFEGFEGFEGFDSFELFNDDNMRYPGNDGLFGSNTVVDKIGRELNKDGLLDEYKSNKIEISGKHLKINGEKMPKALYNKYKNIFQEATGAPLSKKTKMVFDVEGKPSKRKVKTF